MPKIGDLPGVRAKLAGLPPSEITPRLQQIVGLDVPDGTDDFYSMVDKEVSERILPTLTTTAGNIRAREEKFGGRERQIEAGIDPLTGRTFHEQAVGEAWQANPVQPLTRVAAGAQRMIPRIGPMARLEQPMIPPPQGFAEHAQEMAGGAIGLTALAAPLEMGAAAAGLGAVASGAAAMGGASALSGEQTPVGRAVSGVVGAGMAGLSRFIPQQVFKSTQAGFGRTIAAAEAEAGAAGKAAQAEIDALVARGIPREEAQAMAANSVRSAVGATERLAAHEAGAATVAQRAATAAGLGTSTVAFGAGMPLLTYAGNKMLGEDVTPPTLDEIGWNIAALGTLNAAFGASLLRGRGAGRPSSGNRGGTEAPAGSAGPEAPPSRPLPPGSERIVTAIAKSAKFSDTSPNPLDGGRTAIQGFQQRVQRHLPPKLDSELTAEDVRGAAAKAASETRGVQLLYDMVREPEMPAVGLKPGTMAPGRQVITIENPPPPNDFTPLVDAVIRATEADARIGSLTADIIEATTRRLRDLSRELSLQLSGRLRGREIDMPVEGQTRKIHVLDTVIYPWDEYSLRVMGVDMTTNTPVALRFRDLSDFQQAATGLSPIDASAGSVRGEQMAPTVAGVGVPRGTSPLWGVLNAGRGVAPRGALPEIPARGETTTGIGPAAPSEADAFWKDRKAKVGELVHGDVGGALYRWALIGNGGDHEARARQLLETLRASGIKLSDAKLRELALKPGQSRERFLKRVTRTLMDGIEARVRQIGAQAPPVSPPRSVANAPQTRPAGQQPSEPSGPVAAPVAGEGKVQSEESAGAAPVPAGQPPAAPSTAAPAAKRVPAPAPGLSSPPPPPKREVVVLEHTRSRDQKKASALAATMLEQYPESGAHVVERRREFFVAVDKAFADAPEPEPAPKPTPVEAVAAPPPPAPAPAPAARGESAAVPERSGAVAEDPAEVEAPPAPEPVRKFQPGAVVRVPPSEAWKRPKKGLYRGQVINYQPDANGEPQVLVHVMRGGSERRRFSKITGKISRSEGRSYQYVVPERMVRRVLTDKERQANAAVRAKKLRGPLEKKMAGMNRAEGLAFAERFYTDGGVLYGEGHDLRQAREFDAGAAKLRKAYAMKRKWKVATDIAYGLPEGPATPEEAAFEKFKAAAGDDAGDAFRPEVFYGATERGIAFITTSEEAVRRAGDVPFGEDLVAEDALLAEKVKALLAPEPLVARLKGAADPMAEWAAIEREVNAILGPETPADWGADTLSFLGTGPIGQAIARMIFRGSASAMRSFERAIGRRGRTLKVKDSRGNVVSTVAMEFEVDPARQALAYRAARRLRLGAQVAFPPGLTRAAFLKRAEEAHFAEFAWEGFNDALGDDGLKWLEHPWSANSKKLFRAMEGESEAVPKWMAPKIAALRRLLDEMLTMAQERAGTAGLPIPKKLENYVTHIREGLATEATRPLIQELFEDAKYREDRLRDAHNRFFDHREGGGPFIEYAMPAFEIYAKTWARWMATAPFVKQAQIALDDLRDHPDRREAVKDIIKSWMFGQKDKLETGIDESLRWLFFARTNQGIKPIDMDEAERLTKRAPGALKGKSLKRANGKPAAIDRFVFVEKGVAVGFTTTTEWELLGETPGGGRIYGGHGGYAYHADAPLLKPVLEKIGRRTSDAAARIRAAVGGDRSEKAIQESLARRAEIRRWERDPAKMMLGHMARNNLLAVLAFNTRSAIQNLVGGSINTFIEWGAEPFFRGVVRGSRAAMNAAYRNYLRFAHDRGHLTKDQLDKALAAVPMLLEEGLPEALGIVPGEIGALRDRLAHVETPDAKTIHDLQQAIGPMAQFSAAESWLRGMDAATAIMVAQRMGLSMGHLQDLYEGTADGRRRLVQDVLADIGDPKTAAHFVAWQQGFTQYYYDMMGQGLFMANTVGRLFGQLTTYPILTTLHQDLGPLEGAVRTTGAFVRGVRGQGPPAGGGGGGRGGGGGPPKEPPASGWFEEMAAKGGASWFARHAFGKFVRSMFVYGLLLFLTEISGLNLVGFWAPLFGVLALGTMALVLPNVGKKVSKSGNETGLFERLMNKSLWGVGSILAAPLGVVPRAGIGGFAFVFGSERISGIMDAPFMELLRRQALGATRIGQVWIKRSLEGNPEVFDNEALRGLYAAFGQRSALYGLTLDERIKHFTGTLPKEVSDKKRRSIFNAPKKKEKPVNPYRILEPEGASL